MPRPTPAHPDVALKREERLFEGRFFDLYQQTVALPSGLEQDWQFVTHPGASAIAALDEQGRMLMVRQYRLPVGDWLVELPAGRLELDESPLVAAQRELEEETGYRAARWEPFFEFIPAPGFCSEVVYVFLAQGLETVPGGGLACDEDEELELLWMRPEEVIQLAPADSKTHLAAFRLLAR
jgi:ADP-ribose pyrophosphatase